MCGGNFSQLSWQVMGSTCDTRRVAQWRHWRGFSRSETHCIGRHMAERAHNVHRLARIWYEINVYGNNLSKFIYILDAQERFTTVIPERITSKNTVYNSREVPVHKPTGATLVLNNISSLHRFPFRFQMQNLTLCFKSPVFPSNTSSLFSPIHRINVYPYWSKGIVQKISFFLALPWTEISVVGSPQNLASKRNTGEAPFPNHQLCTTWITLTFEELLDNAQLDCVLQGLSDY